MDCMDPLWPADPFTANAGDVASAGDPTIWDPQCKRTHALPHRIWNTENWELAQRFWPPILSRTKKYTLSITQGRIFPHKAISSAQALRALYLFLRKYSRPKAHSYMAKWKLKDHMHGLTFPNSGPVLAQAFSKRLHQALAGVTVTWICLEDLLLRRLTTELARQRWLFADQTSQPLQGFTNVKLSNWLAITSSYNHLQRCNRQV